MFLSLFLAGQYAICFIANRRFSSQEKMQKAKQIAEEIHVLDHRVRLLQPPEGFRTSLDSVMLAAACPAKAGETVLDLGCGVGGAGFCVLARTGGTHLAGIDIQQSHIELAIQNIALNEMEGRTRFITGDIRAINEKEFDHVICNPPYLDAGTHTPSPSVTKATALYHSDETLSVKDWVDAGFRNLKNGGSFTIIHRADHTDKIIQSFGKKFGAIEIIPLYPREGEAAKRVIIRALKNRKTPAQIHPGLILHNKDGSYTGAADRILRGAEAL
jgi:tRNA1(Val) A37 N6-methylase TrmN6